MALEVAKLLAALDNVAVISTTDLQGNITHANDQFCKVTGYTRDELMGKPHNIVRHPAVPKSVYKTMWETIQAGKMWTGVLPNVGKDGKVYVVDTAIQPIFDEKGKAQGYISIRRVINDVMEDTQLFDLAKEIYDASRKA